MQQAKLFHLKSLLVKNKVPSKQGTCQSFPQGQGRSTGPVESLEVLKKFTKCHNVHKDVIFQR